MNIQYLFPLNLEQFTFLLDQGLLKDNLTNKPRDIRSKYI